MSVWFTADPHFGHRFVAGLRGFDDVEEHDAMLVERWSKVVGKHDQVWVLGDIAVSSPNGALEIIEGLPGDKHLIAGNHDSCHPMHRDSHRWQRKYLTAFDSVQPFARRRIDGTAVLLSHFPYSKDRFEVRYTQWRLRDEGEWLLHGHTHQADQRLEGREIHVGVDAWDFTPVPIHVITEMIQEHDERG
jgi:calcineurin-like phosphoesterase family protein